MKEDSKILQALHSRRLFFDGGTGTVLQSMGLPAGTPPEMWNLSEPEKITALHRAYLQAGSNIITTNTFGINAEKYENYEQMITAAVQCAENARAGDADTFIAFDMGPTGRLLHPLGDLAFEDAVSLYAKNVRAAVKAGVDLILIETLNDSYETKAAVLAAKENADLPIFVTNVYDQSGRLMTGADPRAMIGMLESMGVAALGINCSLGPQQMLPVVRTLLQYASVPVIVNPNAGLPVVRDGVTAYDVDADAFADTMAQMAQMGVSILGGCCGTTPDYIRKTKERTNGIPFTTPTPKTDTLVTSYTHAVEIGRDPVLIGERINPTGKSRFKQALRDGDIQYILNEGLRQAECGVHILDVNVGLPEIDEREMMCRAVTALQAVTDLPLQLDSSDPDVLKDAMRLYNGKALINSVNGDEKSMRAVFPLVQKYGGAVIALTMDESGIPKTAQQRVQIAERIAQCAAQYGISQKDLVIDPLTLTVSAEPDSAEVTLEAVRMLKARGFCVSLGVSNISFGLPCREKINAAFFTAALEAGLNCAIVNPLSRPMTDAYHAYRVLHMLDTACGDYIRYTDGQTAAAPAAAQQAAAPSLADCIIRGLSQQAAQAADQLLKTEAPLDVINTQIIPALGSIGKAFEEKKAYLPQLLLAAEAASEAFACVKRAMPKNEHASRGEMILATVQGDIHDIGKNIVRVLMESYGFTVHDLGRDVPPETVVACAQKTGCRLIGLSALMTTTVPAMERTVQLLHRTFPEAKIVVGGAVLNQEYADAIHADHYAPDAMDTVHYAEQYYSSAP